MEDVILHIQQAAFNDTVTIEMLQQGMLEAPSFLHVANNSSALKKIQPLLI
jgi:hypothetical protein